MDIRYYDNAATSFPKCTAVLETLRTFYDEPIGSYGRASDAHTLDVMGEVEDLRSTLAHIALADDVDQEGNVVFTKNATEAINIVIKGLDLKRSEVLLSPLEHNAVTRPVHHLSGEECATVMPCEPNGRVDLEALQAHLEKHRNKYKLICINHASNVNGLVQPLAEIVQLCQTYANQAEILVDTSQSLPYMPLTATVDFVVFNGHKGYRSIPGSGALFLRNHPSLSPLIRGGNGIRSHDQEDSLEIPDRFEAGTQNLLSLLCWARAIKEIGCPVPDKRNDFYRELQAIKGLKLYAESDLLFSISLDNMSISELHYRLQNDWGILSRSGLHCAPLAHQTIGTLPSGTVRLSPPTHLEISDYQYLLHTLYGLSKT